ncbi:hypothetical protein DUZ99_02895 [Xylanibacillus composti]|uniref:Hsp20/alpha crystallin family protein n=1 Tax=Xylanibacillus composti TaxID=1572762 RepID=A0A8J4H2M8_9BACL|nr:Hsp20/alpha crystallin family protein [Xylanibacillus composti]MDT9723945.1 hypothetical protein [Xylanibacillus composti]GIQ67824.1 hypothetical protein XYCOK13_06480 [Xylanibacillus composti]
MPKKTKQPFDWRAFESAMLQQFPVLPKDFPAWNRVQHPSWISDLMQKVLAEGLPAMASGSMPAGFAPRAKENQSFRIFETHRSIILRLHAPPDITSDQIRVAVNPHQVKVRFAGEKRQVIPLPKPVQSGKASALLRDGILELRLPKSRAAAQYEPIRVRE